MTILHIEKAGWREVGALGSFLEAIAKTGGVKVGGEFWSVSLDDLTIDYSERLGGFTVSDGVQTHDFIAYDNGWGWED